MSLLDRANTTLTIYPEVVVTDADGNTSRGPAAQGVLVPAMVWQYQGEAAGDEPLVVGQSTETIYKVRLVRSVTVPVGPWSVVVYEGQDCDVDSELNRHRRGAGTQRRTFLMKPRTPRGVGSG